MTASLAGTTIGGDGQAIMSGDHVLTRVCRQAGLETASSAGADSGRVHREIATVHCSYGTWPGHTFTVTVSEHDLDACLEGAATDVDDLWPGRDPQDGAIALLATSLQAALDVRRSEPTGVVLSHLCRWLVSPPEDLPPTDEFGDDFEWRAT